MPKKPELVVWSPTYSVGIKLVDDQHKGLLDLINDMFNHVVGSEKQEREYFREVIHKTVDYVKIHFATEERIMIATKFPGYQEHKRAHDVFVLKVIDTINDFDKGHEVKFSLSSTTRFLKEWVLTHIAIMDKQYFTFFKSIASRSADGRLRIDSSNII